LIAGIFLPKFHIFIIVFFAGITCPDPLGTSSGFSE